jgi:hypothetical protein
VSGDRAYHINPPPAALSGNLLLILLIAGISLICVNGLLFTHLTQVLLYDAYIPLPK